MSKGTTKKQGQSAKTKGKARQRQKQKLMLTGGLAVVLIVVIAIAVYVIGGFGIKTGDENSVYILKNGKVLSTNIEAFDEGQYSKSELKSYMKEVISDYNEVNGSGFVKQKKFKLKDGVAKSVLQYMDADVFTDFYGTELFVGTVAEAIEAGYSFDIPFASVSGSVKEASSEDFLTDDTYKVAIIRANTKIMVEGTIYYISTDNIAEVGTDYVVIQEGAALEIQTVEDTEAEDVDVSVSDDDLLSEEGGMVFEFEEEEVPTKEYTKIYTYIIYK